MREIKFRAWDKKEKKWLKVDEHSCDWPSLIVVGLHGLPIAIDKNSFQEKEIVGWNINHYVILMQYTGLHDKNGVEIYEGDIVKVKKTNNILEIKFEGSCFKGFDYREETDVLLDVFNIDLDEFNLDCEVIGNKWDSKEPLK